MTAPPIDPSSVITAATSAVTTGVNDNLGTIGIVAGGLLAVGVVWKFAKRIMS